MDTEIRIEKDGVLITAEVTRDKAAEAGFTWSWNLVPQHPSAVLVPTASPEEIPNDGPAWLVDARPLPSRVEQYTGPGAAAIRPLARYMRVSAGSGDAGDLGRTLTEARADLLARVGLKRDVVGDAWSELKGLRFILTHPESTEAQRASGRGRHVWNAEGK
jgi:hypothetical protein